MMNKLLLTILVGLTSLALAAQDVVIRSNTVIIPEGITLDVQEGSKKKYLHEEWLPGTFYYPNGSKRDYEQIKFDRHAAKLRIIVEGAELDVFPSLLSGLIIRDSDVKIHAFVIKEYEGSPSFYEVLSTGDHILLNHVFRKENADDSGNTVGTTTTLRFELEEEVINMNDELFVFTDEKLNDLKVNAKTVAKITGHERKELENFISDNNLDLDKKVHLATLFDYINTY